MTCFCGVAARPKTANSARSRMVNGSLMLAQASEGAIFVIGGFVAYS